MVAKLAKRYTEVRNRHGPGPARGNYLPKSQIDEAIKTDWRELIHSEERTTRSRNRNPCNHQNKDRRE
jgi:hypothetical protein